MTRESRAGHDAIVPDVTGYNIGDAVRAGSAFLGGPHAVEAGTDSRLLLLHVTGLTSLDLVRGGGHVVTRDEALRFAAALARRARHEPVSRIAGLRGFYGREFIVTPDTLDPRADTETLIDAALTLCRECGLDQKPITIVDVGTGTGAILVTLLAELELARGVGIDPSAAALAVARENAARHGVASRASFVAARGLAGYGGAADLVVSNPPYIPTRDIAGLEPDVRDYDPHLALDGGADGLDIYREIASGLVPRDGPGWVVFEVGKGQAGDVSRLLMHALGPTKSHGGVRPERRFRDLGCVERCVAVSTQS